ncbi:hypothetical protein Ga0074812_113107 [Parafrankia irregularis]|uniref:Uncharacterized protein n=1 Tax=Parafrankia irregularis TaxID=795642 RepID=A0A0S4QQY3_9ACTN|nr:MULTISPECIES: hypothetical protein [Parafrankia]MBE3206174.1 hypothetical protein [Parafrankia sp. CH37]CUU57609.1 hypothetical protein Ga0074812_113107 [Parafrankia irregularis]
MSVPGLFPGSRGAPAVEGLGALTVDALNFAFGVIGVLSFGYAIWVNRQAENSRRLTNRLTTSIRDLARSIYDSNRDTTTEGYARSIMQICDSLLPERSDTPPLVGRVVMRYFGSQMPPMETAVGQLVDLPDIGVGRVIRGGYISESRKALVYGPRETLPVRGSYRATFRLAAELDPDVDLPADAPIARIEVYVHLRREKLATRDLRAGELTSTFAFFEIGFTCDSVDDQYEYRVMLPGPGATVSFERVTVYRISD